MLLHKNFGVKELESTVPGELIQFTYRTESALAVVIRIQMQTVLLGVLKNHTGDAPFGFEIRGANHMIVSYGTNWLLEPIVGSETKARNRMYLESGGAIHVHGAETFMYFGYSPEAEFQGGYSLNLNGLQLESPPQTTMPIAKWKIWASEEERRTSTGTPLMEYTAIQGGR